MKPILKKVLIVGAVIIILSIIIYVGLFIFTWFPPKISKATMEKELIKNKEPIISVIDYLTDIPYETASIDDDNIDTGIDLFVYGNENSSMHLLIDDDAVVDNIYFLFKKCNYENITKNGDAISFLRWSDLDNGTGIVYSIDGHIPNESSFDFLTKLESLSEENWYYYEEDFNEWKRLNSQ